MNSDAEDQIAAVRTYWESHVDDWKIATHHAGSAEFFRETEDYRFEKLHYLNDHVPIPESENRSVLEIGCGLGNDLSRFAKQGSKVTGVDLTRRSIELCRANFEQRQLDGKFMEMNGEQLEFADNSFDFVYCHTVLQFTPDPQKMVREIQRVLKPGGTALIMALNKNSWLMLMHRLFKVEIDYLDSPVYHLFSKSEFEQLLSGFSSVNIFSERFPVRTKVHKGIKARIYNALFVDFFNLLPDRWTRFSGHHLLAYASKDDQESGNAA